MIEIFDTKKLMKASERLHKLHTKYKALENEESIFIVDEQDIFDKKLKISEDIREALISINECVLLLDSFESKFF